MIYLNRIRKSSLVTGAGTYIVASMINASIPFMLLPILTRYLSPSEYGEVAMYQVWVALIGALCGLSVHGAAVRKYYDYEDPDKKIGEFIFSCIILLILSTAILSLILLFVAGWISATIGLSEKWMFIGVLYAFCNFLIQIRLGQWQVRKNPQKYGALQISLSLVNMVLSIVLVVVFAFGASGRLTGSTAAIIIIGIISFYLLRRGDLIRLTWRPDLIKEAAYFGVPLIPHTIGAFLLLTVDRAIISAQLGLEAAGHYMVAAQFAMILGLFLTSVNKAFVPWLYERLKRDDQAEKRFIVKLTYFYGLFLSGIAFIAFLIGDKMVVFVAGETYLPAADIVAYLVLAKVFHGMYFMIGNYILFEKKTFVIAKITIIVGIVNIALIFFLTKEYGLAGSAFATCIGMALQFLITWLFASRLVRMPWLLK